MGRELAFQHLPLRPKSKQSRYAHFVLDATSLQLIPPYSKLLWIGGAGVSWSRMPEVGRI
jgi:hypothetical protein